MILVAIPYAIDREYFGRAVNEVFESVNDDDWVYVMDHDCMFTTQNWYRTMAEAIDLQPDAGLFTHWYSKARTHPKDWDPVVSGLHCRIAHAVQYLCCRVNERCSDIVAKWKSRPPNHDSVRFHRQMGACVENRCNQRLIDVTEIETIQGKKPTNLSGNFLMSKKVWNEIGGLPDRTKKGRRVDWAASRLVRSIGRKMYLMNSLYVYHWKTG